MNRKKETIKVILAVTLCLGVFAFGFVTINNLTVAASMDRPELVESTQVIVNVQDSIITSDEERKAEAIAISEDLRNPEMILNVIFDESVITRTNAILPEDAAQIGAHHIYNMFGEDISGKTVLMIYSDYPSSTRTFWGGFVAESGDIDDVSQIVGAGLFNFLLDAVTGECIDISTSIHWMTSSDELTAALEELFENRTREDTIELRSGGPVPENLDELINTVRYFAQKHFTDTSSGRIEFKYVNALRYDFDNDDNIYVSERSIVFEVTDNTGRVADIAITENGKQLIFIFTSNNDIIPGFVYDSEESGLG
jgi:hypothetical protein